MYQITYPFVWTPKFRRPVLAPPVGARLDKLLREKAAELDGKVIDLTVQPDHVHLFCSFNTDFFFL